MMRVSVIGLAFLVGGWLPSVSQAGGLPARFTLGRFVPGDVWMYMHHVRNPERAWLDQEWAEVFDALKASGVAHDAGSLLLSLLPHTDCTALEERIGTFTELVKKVQWGDLCQEFALGERVAKTPMGYEYVILARNKPGTIEKNFAGVGAILEWLASLSEKTAFTQRDVKGLVVWHLRFEDPQAAEVPFTVDLFRKDDVIGLVIGKDAFGDVHALMTGKSEQPAIVATSRFAEALASVDPPEDGVMFFDAKRLFGGLNRLMETVSRKNAPDDKEARLLTPVRAGLGLFDILDYSIVTMETQGRRELSHSVVRLQECKRKCALASACLDRRPFERFDEFVPIDATEFSVNGLVDLEQLYNLVTGFVEKEVPEGPGYLATWNELLTTVGFDPKRDLFDWWSGEMVHVTVPAAAVTPMGGADSVMMFRVKNAELAASKLDAAISFVNDKLRQSNQMLMVRPADVSAPGFRQITHPLLMMWLRPVVGVTDGWLVVGSSAGAINKCLDVAAGKAPSLRESERFKSEGLLPEGSVMAASFKDTARFGDELGAAIGMAGVVGGMFAATTQQQDPPIAGDKLALFQKVMALVGRLGPVVQKIDFYSSESSVTTFDRNVAIRTERVVTYKPPKSDEAKTANAAR